MEDAIAALRLPGATPADTNVVVPLGDPPQRRCLGALALVGALLGLLGVVLGPWPAALCAAALVALVPGSLLLAMLPRVPRVLAVAAVPAMGAAVVACALSLQLGLSRYSPEATRWILIGLGLLGGGWILARNPGRPSPPSYRAPTRGVILPLLLGALATACWIWAMPAVRASSYSSYGLGAQVPLLVVAGVLATVSVLLALRAGAWWAAWLALLLLVLARRGYTLWGASTPLYQWTYRHLGVMDWFTHSGALARDVDVYSNWPGSLALAAWLTQVSELSRFDLASAYVIGHHVVLVVFVYVLARAAGLDRGVALLAATLVEITDWVGQDYLAPQSFGLLLAAVVIAGWLASREPAYRAGSLWVAAIVFTGITWAHQLTPVWLLAMLLVFVALRIVRPAWVLAPFFGVWAVTIAVNLEALLAHSTGLSLNVLSNSEGNISSPVSAGQSLTSWAVTALALALWGGAAVVSTLRFRRERAGVVAAVLAFSPMILLLTGYGGEAIYRVYLYSLLGVAIILAPPLARALHAGATRSALAGAGVVLAAVAALQGSLGGWYTALFPPSDVQLAQRLEGAAGNEGVIATPVVGFPREVTWHYVPQVRRDALAVPIWSLENELVTPARTISPTPVTLLTEATRRQMADAPVYVVIAEPMRVYAEQYGAIPAGGLDELSALLARAGWTAIHVGETVVYTNPAGMQAWEHSAP